MILPAIMVGLLFVTTLASVWIPSAHAAWTTAVTTVLAGGLLASLGWVYRVLDGDLAAPFDALDQASRTGGDAVRTIRRTGLAAPLAGRVAELLDVEARDRERPRDPRARLETLLRDLHLGVIVCTLDHTLLLYNARAVELLKTDGEVGLDRSVAGVLALLPLAHAAGRLVSRLESGHHREHPDGLATTVIAASSSRSLSVRARMSLLLDDAESDAAGYVLTFDDVTESLAAALVKERALRARSEALRRRACAVRLLVDTMPERAEGDGVRAKLAAEAEALSAEIASPGAVAEDGNVSAWPMSVTFSRALFSNLADRVAMTGGRRLTVEGDPVWLRCDSFSITELLDRLIERVGDGLGVEEFVAIATRNVGGRAYLDLSYDGRPVETDALERWLDEPLHPDHDAVTGRDVLDRHGTDVWCSADRSSSRPRLRLSLPALLLAGRADPKPGTRSEPLPGARDEFYDFDLLGREPARRFVAGELETPLDALTCVAFDTETTGLNPMSGDEIVSIGAARLVNGRLLRGEIFNEFVRPSRPIPSASIRIHGITDAMVADAPPLVETLPRFLRFAEGAVPIAHNAAFDLAFLERAAGRTPFEGAVLDTLLLGAIVTGHEEKLDLDTLATRFGAPIAAEDRHTALGDALATGHVFLGLLPGLRAKGILTLGDALAASERQHALRHGQAVFRGGR